MALFLLDLRCRFVCIKMVSQCRKWSLMGRTATWTVGSLPPESCPAPGVTSTTARHTTSLTCRGRCNSKLSHTILPLRLSVRLLTNLSKNYKTTIILLLLSAQFPGLVKRKARSSGSLEFFFPIHGIYGVFFQWSLWVLFTDLIV